MRFERRLQVSSASVLCLLLIGCGGNDRSASGPTNGTEAGNAVTARLFVSGQPARGARVVARPSDAIDSSQQSTWIEEIADFSGQAHMLLPDGDWTLEARLDSHALSVELHGAKDTIFEHSLDPTRKLRGIVLGVDSGSRIYLPGLAVSTIVGSGGAFEFTDVPAGSRKLRESGGATWTLSGLETTPVLAKAQGVISGSPFLLPALPVPARIWIRDSLLPTSPLILTTSGTQLPHIVGPLHGSLRQMWVGPSIAPTAILTSSRSAFAISPFDSSTGLSSIWIPEFGHLRNLVDSSSHLRLGRLSVTKIDSLEGEYWTGSPGDTLGIFDIGRIADSSESFSILVRVRAYSSADSSNVFCFADPSEERLRFDVATDHIRVKSTDLDTSLAIATSSPWNWYALVVNGADLRVYSNGTRILQTTTHSLTDRRTWTNGYLGLSSRIEIGAYLAWSRPIDGVAATKQQTPGLTR